jgi:hypothetical protein
MRTYIPERNLTNTMTVEKPLQISHLENMKQVIQKKNATNLMNSANLTVSACPYQALANMY